MTDLIIIAEAGVNHNGDAARAREMVAAASDAGADYVKFQAFRAEDLVAAGTGTAAYQAENSGEHDQAALLRGLELSMADFESIAACCADRDIGFLCTAFDVDWLDRFIALGMDRIKIPSGELTNLPSLERIGAIGLPILLSTGMATLEEVADAVRTLRRAGAEDITLLHCTSLYPAPAKTLNLGAIRTMAGHFDLPAGYSDHSLGDHASIAAVALGAVVIEKHFTLDRTLPGPDHAASLEPDELADMVGKLRETVLALGDGTKCPAEGEADVASLVRRSWHAVRELAAGHVIQQDDVVLKRPADGLSPAASPVGARLKVVLGADEALRPEHLEQEAV